MRKARKYYSDEARDLLRGARAQKRITARQLAGLLREHGESIEPQVLINKINRGTFSMQFAFQCLAAMGVKTIEIPDYAAYKARQEAGIGPAKKINDPTFEMPELTDDDDMHR